MISLIQFNSDLVMEREEAINLGLIFKEIIGYRIGYKEDRIRILDSTYYKLLGEDAFVSTTYPSGYEDEEGKEIASYYVYSPLNKKELIKNWVEVKQGGHMVDLFTFAQKCTYPFSIIKSLHTADTTINDIDYILAKIEEKVANLDNAVEKATKFNFNSKCNVHIGGGLIVTFNEVKLMENSCSDELQRELNGGWRIMAVCVQPDQRRPDYVLGRYNPDLDVQDCGAAKRK